MQAQTTGGNKKQTRKKRALRHIDKQASRQYNREMITVNKGHAKSRRYGDRPIIAVPPEHIKPQTFEDEYRLFRKTRGARGLQYNEKRRPAENPNLARRNSVFACGRFPIGELMEHPISNLAKNFYFRNKYLG